MFLCSIKIGQNILVEVSFFYYICVVADFFLFTLLGESAIQLPNHVMEAYSFLKCLTLVSLTCY